MSAEAYILYHQEGMWLCTSYTPGNDYPQDFWGAGSSPKRAIRDYQRITLENLEYQSSLVDGRKQEEILW